MQITPKDNALQNLKPLDSAHFTGPAGARELLPARKPALPTSTMVVRFEPGRSLLDQGGLLMELRELLGISVDVVSEGALTGRFGEIVRKEAVPL